MQNLLKGIYSIYLILVFIVLLLINFPFLIVVSFLPISLRDKVVHYMLLFNANAWCYLSFIFPKSVHKEKIQFNNSYVITANHQTYFDPVQMYTALPHYFKGVGKVEVTKAPLFGLMYRMAVISVDRSSTRKSASTYRNMLRYLRSGWSVLIFPEATFPDQIQDNLLAFKKGAFALAQKEQKEILPLLFIDATKRMHPSKIFRFSPGLLTTVFLPPIKASAFAEEVELRKFTQTYMQACLDHCRANDAASVYTFALGILNDQNNNS